MLVDIGQRFLEVVRREVSAPGFAAAVDTGNPEEGITDRPVPRGCCAVLSSLFNEVDEQDMHIALDLVDLVVPAHFVHLIE
jgi:hypothetical protein